MFIRTFTRIAAGFAVAITFAGASFAQSTVLVVDSQKVLKDSLVGQHVGRQLEAIVSSAQSEMKAKATPLESKSRSVEAQLKTKTSREQIASDAGLKSQIQSLQSDKQNFQMEGLYTQEELKITERKALAKVSQRISTIIEQIAVERNADVILEKSLIIYGGPAADVTDLVISRLNSQMTTVPVTRERLPRKG